MKKLSVSVFFALLSISITSCQQSKESSQPVENSNEQTAEVFYTCSMHPDVASKEAGKCPVCGMDLTKKEMSSEETEHDHTDSTEHK
jgi:Cu(I)/Ag(I) efflux system membrane fusion protein